MKNAILTVAISFLIVCCQSDDSTVADETLTEQGTIYYYFDPGFVFSNCYYVFEADNSEIYVISRGTDILRELSSEIEENNGLNLELTFRPTDKPETSQCLHKREWLPEDTIYIWVESYKKI